MISSIAATPKRVAGHVLPNGMRVHIEELEFADLVYMQAVVGVGSLDETTEEAGIAHLLEHMIFNGTASFPNPGDVARAIESEGGEINAWTTLDHTAVYIAAHATFLERGLGIMEELLCHAKLSEASFAKEKPIVLDEEVRSRDNPGSVLSRTLLSALYPDCAMGRPVIGSGDSIAALTQEQVVNFYRKWYVPNNISLVIVGKVDAEKVLHLVEQFAHRFESRILPPRQRDFATPFLNNIPFVHIDRGPWQEARVRLAVPGPALEDEETPAWDVFSSLLGRGDASRLVRQVRDEKQLVTAIEGDLYAPLWPHGFMGAGFFGRGETMVEALEAIAVELAELSRKPPKQEELERILNAVLAGRVYALESIEGIGRNVAHLMTTRIGLVLEERYLEAIRRVTPKDMCTIATEICRKIVDGRFALCAALGDEVCAVDLDAAALRLRKIAATAFAPVEDESLFPSGVRAVWTTSAYSPSVQQRCITLRDGRELHINCRRNDRLPICSILIGAEGGQWLEDPAHGGLADLTVDMMGRGTETLPYQDFVNRLDDFASSLGLFSSKDFWGMQVDSLSEHANATLDLALDCLFRPAFAEQEWNRVKRESIESLAAQRDQPSVQLGKLSGKLLFPNHVYGRPQHGTEESLASLTLDLIKSQYRQLFSAKKFVVGIAGKMDSAWAAERIEMEFNSMIERCGASPDQWFSCEGRAPAALDYVSQVAFHVMEREQAHLSLVFPSYSVADSKKTALEMGMQILGGQGGRLFKALREDRSLAYALGAGQQALAMGGLVSASVATSPAHVEEVLQVLKQELERLACEPPLEAELSRARRSVTVGFAQDSQRVRFQCTQLAVCDLFHLPFDHFLRFEERIDRVKPADISAALRDLLCKSQPLISIVGPQGTFVPEAGHSLLRWTLS